MGFLDDQPHSLKGSQPIREYISSDVPDEQAEQNVRELWAWLDGLREQGYEKVRFAGSGRKVVSRHAIDDCAGDAFGVSIIEADSLEAAVSLTADLPELQYGGRIEVLEALPV